MLVYLLNGFIQPQRATDRQQSEVQGGKAEALERLD